MSQQVEDYMKRTWLMLMLLSVSVFNKTYAKESLETGEGRNGPDQKGYSIPVTLDQFIPVANFEAAAGYCIRKERMQVLEQILRKKLKYYYVYYKDSDRADFSNSYVTISYQGDLPSGRSWITSIGVDTKNFEKSRFYFSLSSWTMRYEKNTSYPNFEIDDQTYRILNNFLKESYSQDRGEGFAAFVGGISVNANYVFINPDLLGYSDQMAVKSFEIKNEKILRLNPKTKEKTETVLFMDIEKFRECLFNNMSKKAVEIYENKN